MRRAPALRPAPPVPPVAPPTDGGDDLYRLYVRAAGASETRVRTHVPPGPLRDRALRNCRPLPREYFEAKYERLCSSDAAAYRREMRRVIAAYG